MLSGDIKQRSLAGILWKFCEKVGTQVVQFIIQIFLARLLMPEDYGLIGLLTIFINISDVFILQGFSTALIQKKDASEMDFSSVFYANIGMSVLIYTGLFLMAPFVAIFYNEPQLTLVMRVLSLNVIIGAFSAVHNSIMSKNLEFKKSFLRGLSNTLTYGIVGVTLAYFGYGVWSLVYAKLSGLAVGTVVLWITVNWKPRFMFSFSNIKTLFAYSSKLLGTNLLNTVFNNIHSLVIGKFFNKSDLGYYQRGQQIPQTIMTAIDGSMSEVMYPTFSILQDDIQSLKSAMRRSMKTSMYLIFPVLVGLFVTAKPLTVVLLTDKWISSVPYMQLTCILCAFWPFSARIHALNALGKSGETFKISIISKILTLIFILCCVSMGIYAIIIGTILASLVSFFISSYFVNKYLHYSLKELLIDILPSLLLSVLVGYVIYLFTYLNINDIWILVLQILVGISIYVIGSIILKIDSFNYLLSFAKRLLHKHN